MQIETKPAEQRKEVRVVSVSVADDIISLVRDQRTWAFFVVALQVVGKNRRIHLPQRRSQEK
jgi:hypothetical protein